MFIKTFIYFIPLTLIANSSLAENRTIKSPSFQLRKAQKTSVNISKSEYYKSLYKNSGSFISRDLLKEQLHKIIAKDHCYNSKKESSYLLDEGKKCASDEKLIQYKSFGYKTARSIIFGDVDLKKNAKREYYIKGFYCELEYSNKTHFYGAKSPVGRLKTPDQKILNIEHVWPQSKFKEDKDKFVKKSDLHHLRPADALVNNKRGSKQFSRLDNGEFVCVKGSDDAKERTILGSSKFQPAPKIRGDIARMVFYFAIMYNKKITELGSPELLLNWHRNDPVTYEEKERNDLIFLYQQNRNPFIDIPELANKVFN
jgi:hypothetical protein